MKKLREPLKLLPGQLKNLVSLNDKITCTAKVFPNISTVVILVSVCPASGIVVEGGFSLMNLIMNDLTSNMNVLKQDATMRSHYQGISLNGGEVDEIIDVCNRQGNR